MQTTNIWSSCPYQPHKRKRTLIFKIAQCDKKQTVLFRLRAQDGGVGFENKQQNHTSELTLYTLYVPINIDFP